VPVTICANCYGAKGSRKFCPAHQPEEFAASLKESSAVAKVVHLQPHYTIRKPTQAALLGLVTILDRLVHNAHRIELRGESMRKTRAKKTESQEENKPDK
jgi:hypothetical protein